MVKVQRLSLAGQAAAIILDRVVAGDWVIGTKLPGEAALAAELGVGRSTVREAIRDLAGRGVLDTRQGAGVFVIAAAPAENWHDVLRRAAIAEVVEGRLAVEVEAACRAAQRRTPDDLDAIDAALIHRANAARVGDDADYVDADLEFHHAVVVAAHNTVLAELFGSFRPRIRDAMLDMLALLGPGDPRTREVHDAHRAIVQAIRAGDRDLSAALSRTHLEDMHKRITGPA